MGGDAIKQAVGGAVDHLTANPAEARYRDGLATAVVRDGLIVDVTGANGESITTDMPTGIGGTASAASPGWLFRAAIASCVATLVALRAATLGVRLGSLEVLVDSESDDRGIFGIDDATPAGPLSARVEVRIESPSTDAVLRAIVDWGVEHCPVLDGLRRSVPVEVLVVLESAEAAAGAQ